VVRIEYEVIDPSFDQRTQGLLGSHRGRAATSGALVGKLNQLGGPIKPRLFDQRLEGIRDRGQLAADQVEVRVRDHPLADLRWQRLAKARGYLTFADKNDALPPQGVKSLCSLRRSGLKELVSLRLDPRAIALLVRDRLQPPR
jgi:hypothetical protein